MSRPIKVATGTEAQMVALQATVDKALGYPRRGTRVGNGPPVNVPETWDGTGPVPLGWTRTATAPWLNGPSDAVLPIPDDLAAELQGAPARARLTGPERASVASAIAGRGSTILDGRTPKANAVQGAAGRT